MEVTCKCCGKTFNAFKGNRKYCSSCRDEICRNQYLYGGYAKTAKVLIEKHKDERENNERLNRLRKTAVSIDYVVRKAMAHGRSYGHEVAVMEGREY